MAHLENLLRGKPPSQPNEGSPGSEDRLQSYMEKVQRHEELFTKHALDGENFDPLQLWKLSFHIRLQVLKRRSRLSWAQLANQAGVSRRTLFNLSQGRHVTAETEERVAQALGVTRIVLIGGRDKP